MLNQLIVTSVAAGARQPRSARRIALAKPPQFHIKNKATLIGFTGNDAEVHTNNGRSFVTFQLATKSFYKKDGKYIWETEWHRCVVFGKKLGEFAATLKKGAHLQVEGPYRSREYTSTKTDNDVRIWEVRVTSILKLDRAAKAAPEEQDADDDSTEEQAA